MSSTDWKFAHRDETEELARLHYFTMKKTDGEQSVEFVITVYEYVKPPDPSMLFFARADKQTNQQVAPYTPAAWGRSVLEALANCMEEIRRFPYQPREQPEGVRQRSFPESHSAD